MRTTKGLVGGNDLFRLARLRITGGPKNISRKIKAYLYGQEKERQDSKFKRKKI